MVPGVAGSIPVIHPLNKNAIDSQAITIAFFMYCQKKPLHCQTSLIMPSEKNIHYPYKLAKLVHHDYSKVKKWYIDFHAYSVNMGRLKRKRIFEFNNIASIQKRKLYAERLVVVINEMLVNGYHFDNAKLKKEEYKHSLILNNQFLSVDDALSKILEVRKNDLSHSSYLSYKSKLNIFIKYLERRGKRHESIKMLTVDNAFDYVDYLTITLGQTGTSINNSVSVLKTVFGDLKDRGFVRENIFSGIKKRKAIITKQNLAYTDSQASALKQYLEDHDPKLLLFCELIFYTYLRPIEIRSLKWKNVSFDKSIIYLNANSSKVKTERYVQLTRTIASKLEAESKRVNDLDAYIFSSPVKGKYYPLSKNIMSEKMRRVLDKLDFDKHYTLYSWKHSGVVKAYKQGVGLYAIMKQCGHTEIDTTARYLKSLGLMRDTEFTDKMDGVSL